MDGQSLHGVASPLRRGSHTGDSCVAWLPARCRSEAQISHPADHCHSSMSFGSPRNKATGRRGLPTKGRWGEYAWPWCKVSTAKATGIRTHQQVHYDVGKLARIDFNEHTRRQPSPAFHHAFVKNQGYSSWPFPRAASLRPKAT